MKEVNMYNWNRKDHFNYFKALDYPHFSLCGIVDITEFKSYTKGKELPFFITFLYAVVRAANEIKEFRFRIREDKVVEHEVVNPSFTVMSDEGVFSFCTALYKENFSDFLEGANKEIERVKKTVYIEDEIGKDDLLYITSIPWVSFTNITHPIHMHPVDSIPRISWGKYFDENGRVKIPLSVQVHHALVDGVHIGLFFENLQGMLNEPAEYVFSTK